MTTNRDTSGELLNAGIERLDAADYEQALDLFEQAASADVTFYAPHFQIGLVYKFTRRWPEAAAAFARALELASESLSASRLASVLWNVGISASKVADWPRAYAAWAALGNPMGRRPDGSPSVPMGLAWVQQGGKAPALGERIDPARVIVIDSRKEATGLEKDYVVVHDGARVGTLSHDGVELPVFPAL